jgi:hypothetical protein
MLQATIFSTVRGIVHDPSHRPIAGPEVTLQAKTSNYAQSVNTADDGSFEFAAVGAGEYLVSVKHALSKFSVAATPPNTATAPMASSTLSRELVLKATASWS